MNTLFTQNIVIIARNFNPSLFSQLWLIKNEIIKEEEFKAGCIFSDGIAQIFTPKFTLIVLPQELHFTPASNIKDSTVIDDYLKKIVSLIPHTPFVGAGINFVWQIDPNGETISKYSRKHFYLNHSKLFKVFDAEDANFGVYLSKNVKDSRLKLTITPIRVLKTNPETKEVIQGDFMNLSYNFHFDIKQDINNNISTKLLTFLSNWEHFRSESITINQTLND